MTVTVRCVCEKTLKVPDRFAGKSVTCPSCGTHLPVPEASPDPGFEVVDDEPVATAIPARAKPVSARPAVASVDPEDEEDDDRPRRRSRRDDDDDEEEDRRPRRRRRKDKEPEHAGIFGTEKWVISGGVIGGAIAMLVAVVWFVLGLMADRIFFYPPILFVVGLFGLVKGMMTRGGD